MSQYVPATSDLDSVLRISIVGAVRRAAREQGAEVHPDVQWDAEFGLEGQDEKERCPW